MQYFQMPQASMIERDKTYGLYEEYSITDPISKATSTFNRVIGHFTLEELQAYSAALQAIVTQATTPAP